MSIERFEHAIIVHPNDIDELGHVNNVIYLRWVQEAAAAHWQHAAPAIDREKLLWVVIRHEIDYRRPATTNDALVARTWVGEASRARFERLTEIARRRDGEVLARARTIWCPIDAETRRPTSVRRELRDMFSESLE